MIQNYINHIVFVIDASGSMQSHAQNVINVFNKQIAYLAKRSTEMQQETRVSVYTFSDTVSCLIYDMDVMRLPDLTNYYRTVGGTALVDAADTAIEDLKQTPQKYADHAFLIYVLTDGEENSSRKTFKQLQAQISRLEDNWTLAVLVPNQTGVFAAKGCGFPADNIQVWDTTTRQGFEAVGRKILEATDNFMVNRSKGIRGTKSLFSLNTGNLTTRAVTSEMTEVRPELCSLLNVQYEAPIREYVQDNYGAYTIGSVFYELVKPEKIQAGKRLALRHRSSGRVYEGDAARTLLGLPNYEVKVDAADHAAFDIFVQSTSVNRKLVKGQNILIIR